MEKEDYKKSMVSMTKVIKLPNDGKVSVTPVDTSLP
jgi:hypothetical protein